MAIEYRQSNIHWNYYLAIEKDFENISRYVEFTEANHHAFSIEFARIIMASSQEIDGIMKKICGLIVEGSTPQNINEYKEIIIPHLGDMITETAYASRFGMSSRPWINWLEGNNPDWWRANNNIKHDRTLHFEQANLINAFNSVGALLIVTCYFYKLHDEKQQQESLEWQDILENLKPNSALFSLDPEKYYGEVKYGKRDW